MGCYICDIVVSGNNLVGTLVVRHAFVAEGLLSGDVVHCDYIDFALIAHVVCRSLSFG